MKVFAFKSMKPAVILGLILIFGQTVFTQDGGECFPRSLEVLYQQYVSNYQSDDPEKFKIALEAAKEYVKKNENNGECSDVTSYFKEAITALENKIVIKPVSSSQENGCSQSNRISVGYILSKFVFTSRITKPAGPINEKLIEEVLERKVNFKLNAEYEKSLREAGASDLLLKTISENYQPGTEIEVERLYQIYINNFQSNKAENLKLALDAAKEFVRKFEIDGCQAEQVKYFKDAIPIIEEVLPHPHPRRGPKIDLKYRILKELTDKYKAKNYDEVFALGKKVYELDPEFVALFNDLASLGFEQAKLYGSKSKYNAETVFYAKLAVKLLENSEKVFSIYSGLGYSYKTKAEALNRMKEILDFMKNQNLYKTAEPKK